MLNYIISYFFSVVKGDENAGVDELSQEEVFEEKLREAMDLATQKSAQGNIRVNNCGL